MIDYETKNRGTVGALLDAEDRPGGGAGWHRDPAWDSRVVMAARRMGISPRALVEFIHTGIRLEQGGAP